MKASADHAFGRLSGYTDAYMIYSEKKAREDSGSPLVYYSHGGCHSDEYLKKCKDARQRVAIGIKQRLNVGISVRNIRCLGKPKKDD